MINVPDRVKKALFEKGWTQKKLCAEIDISENGFKNMADKNTWKLETLEKMAYALGVPVSYFVMDANENLDSIQKSKSNDGSFQEFSQRMEAKFDKLTSELDIKNQQIAGLHQMLISVLGKFEGVTEDQPGKLMRLVSKDFNSYTMTVAIEAVDMLKPVFKPMYQGIIAGDTPFSHAENMVTIK